MRAARGRFGRGWLAAVLLWGLPSPAAAAPAQRASPAPAPLTLAVDADDDDGDGVADNAQPTHIPARDLLALPAALLRGAERLELKGDAVRWVVDGKAMPARIELGRAPSAKPPRLQGVRAGRSRVHIHGHAGSREVSVDVARLSLLNGDNHALTPRDTLRVSLAVTNDDTLPRQTAYHTVSADRRNVRVELDARPLKGLTATARLSAYAPGGELRDSLELPLRRSEPRGPLRSAFVRLVSDEVDRTAPGIAGHALRVALRDRVQLSYVNQAGTELTQRHEVLKPGATGGPDAALAARLNVFVLRTHPGGPPVIGRDDLSAVRTAQAQLDAANEVWLQCGIGFGRGREAAVALVAPPPPSLIAVSDGDGLPATGGGEIRLRVGGVDMPSVSTRSGATPLDTAMDIAAAVRSMGLYARVTRNPRTQYGHGPSADVQVTTAAGAPVRVAPVEGRRPSSDRRQRVRIGAVDIGDGIEEFDNMNARAGTLEERALIKAFSDDDPATIELFIINRFTNGTRQGEAFIESGAGAIVNTLLIDRNGLRQQPTAWTLAHELGHVLLDEPLHPDNVGPDRPWQLMDSDSSRGTVYGPKRLDEAECARVRHESGPGAQPQLLLPVP